MIRGALSQRGADVATVSDGPDALQSIQRRSFDLILTDIKMPWMDGLQLFASIVRLAPALSEKVIFLTGDTMNPRTREFLHQGGHLFLAKPFKIEQLLDAILKKLDPTSTAGPRESR
jgi:CheY-like chemotaxis protein